MFNTEAGYLSYVVALCWISGVAILTTDFRIYKKKKMRREGKYAFFLGCLNLVSGAVVCGGSVIYSMFFR